MSHEFVVSEIFSEFCANGDMALNYLMTEIVPWKKQNPDGIIIFNFENIRRINSSFANALIGNALALYGKEFIRIKGLREELKVVIVAALVYGETIKQQENTSDDSVGLIQKLLHLLKQNKKTEE